MRFMMIVKATKDSEAGVLPTQENLTAMAKYNEDLARAGVLIDGTGLHPSSKGAKVSFAPGRPPRVLDGPFTEAKELIAGFWIIDVKSKEEAIEWAKRVPYEPGDYGAEDTIELRQLFDIEDFGQGEGTERHKALGKKLAARSKGKRTVYAASKKAPAAKTKKAAKRAVAKPKRQARAGKPKKVAKRPTKRATKKR